MFLSIATTHQPATDLGFLLNKHPERMHELELTYGKVLVFYPEASEARCEAYLWGVTDLELVIDRLTAYADAGADCLYAPGLKSREDIGAVVKAVHPRPVNLLVGAAGSLADIGALGVRRISVGGSLARMAWAGFMKASREMAEKGTFSEFANGYPGGELNKMFQ